MDYLPGYTADNKALNFAVLTVRKITHLLCMTKFMKIHRGMAECCREMALTDLFHVHWLGFVNCWVLYANSDQVVAVIMVKHNCDDNLLLKLCFTHRRIWSN